MSEATVTLYGPVAQEELGVELRWRLLLRAGSERAASRLLSRVEQRLGVPLEGREYRRSTASAAHWDAFFTTGLSPGSADACCAVCQALEQAGRLAAEWHVTVPRRFEGGALAFHGVRSATSGFVVAGIEWAHFQLLDAPCSAEERAGGGEVGQGNEGT